MLYKKNHSKKELIINNIPLIFILIAGIIIRIMFYKSINGPIHISDSATYIGGAKNLYNHFWFDEFRPPIYLIQLILTGIIFSWEKLDVSTVIIQSTVGIINIVFLYKLVLEITKSKFTGCTASFLAIISMNLFCWDFMILTENLSMLTVTLVTYNLVLYLKYNNSIHLKTLIVLLFTSIFTKPFFMVLPVVAVIIILIRHYALQGKIMTTGFKKATLGIASIYILLIIYSTGNYIQHSFFGITTVGKVNTFGKILQYNMEDLGTNCRIIEEVKEAFATESSEFIVNGKFLEPWHFIGTYGWNKNHYIEIGNFSREIILKNPAKYSFKSLKLTWDLLSQSPFQDYIAEYEISNAGHPNGIMLKIKKITDYFNLLFFLVIVLGLELIIMLAVKKRQFFLGNEYPFFVLFLMVLYHYIISAFFSYGDYSRLIAPCYPLIYAIMAIYPCRLIKFIINRRGS